MRVPEHGSSRRCPLCRGSQVPGQTTFTADLQDRLVVIRHVPAWVCNQCGESFIDSDVARELEAMVASARARNAEVEIISAAHLSA